MHRLQTVMDAIQPKQQLYDAITLLIISGDQV